MPLKFRPRMVRQLGLMEYESGSKQVDLSRAAQCLAAGNLVVFPTETVYGLGADATNPSAISRIYSVKGRPSNHPLIVHILKFELAKFWASEIPEYAVKLAKNFWPGPMTLVLKRNNLAKDFITGGQNKIALRVPKNNIALNLLQKFEELGGFGIAAPSANRFGAVSPTSLNDAQLELAKYLTNNDIYLDGGECEIGIESTIIDCTKKIPSILRPGGITSELIQDSLDMEIKESNSKTSFRFPGNLKSHYCPRAKVVLDGEPKNGDGFLALKNIPTPNGVFRLAEPKDNIEFAKVLYASFRFADHKGLDRIFIIPPNHEGIGAGVLDRIVKSVG